ncbi:LysR family transcriptional regulator [Sinorhizobium medicae]|uniref:LysR family transcriptional regulator n=1 Tax=Sinorhizobium medicae TaxID=110321 RepID=UPI000FD77819|nr:LysR family transcriptional regulator [Sinorhizobium medicae]RVI94425.1 LysR family transcriptional regulator [Sinorhizobium medicae]
MPSISLSLVQTFYQLGRTGSYTAAARELNLSHPSVANHIRRLEHLLGERLVIAERGARRVELTPRGLALYELIRPEFDIMLTRLTRLMESQRPVLRIGMPQGISHDLFPGVVRKFHESRPDVELVVYERDTALAALVRQGSLDIFIAERHFGDPVVTQQLIGRYGLSLVYPRSWGPPPAEADIPKWVRGRPLILHEPGQIIRDMATDFLGRKGAVIEPLISVSSSVSIKRYVGEGLGFSILPSWSAGPEDETIIRVDLPSLTPVPIYFGTAHFLRESETVRALFNHCQFELSGR